MAKLYFLKRHGGYFRPGAHGYTDDIFAAGIFDHKTAHSYGYVESPRVEVIPIEDMREEVMGILAKAKTTAGRAEALIKSMIVGDLPYWLKEGSIFLNGGGEDA